MNGEENFGLWKNLWKTRKSAEPANMVIFAGADAEETGSWMRLDGWG